MARINSSSDIIDTLTAVLYVALILLAVAVVIFGIVAVLLGIWLASWQWMATGIFILLVAIVLCICAEIA